mmetsp:Transcript_28303/g.45530  ORF Transcript_28303/g.45530 Transcript_28303/m.45530 type:complete len:318 (+) Transcript_28303:3-956(+)
MKDTVKETSGIPELPPRCGLITTDKRTGYATTSSHCYSANAIMLFIVVVPLLLILGISSRLYSMDKHTQPYYSKPGGAGEGEHFESLPNQFGEGIHRFSASSPSSPPSPPSSSQLPLERRLITLEASITALKQSIDSLSKEVRLLKSEQRSCIQYAAKPFDSGGEVENIRTEHHSDNHPHDQFQKDMGIIWNVAYIFQKIDRNLDGILDEAEFIHLISRRADLRGRSSSSTHPEASRNAMEFGSELLDFVDLDGDKIVQLCEWLNALQKQGNPINLKSIVELATACEISIPPIEGKNQRTKETSLLETRLKQCLKLR